MTRLEQYHRLAVWCLGGALFFLTLAAVLFFLWDIRSILRFFRESRKWRGRMKKSMLFLLFLLCGMAGSSRVQAAQEPKLTEFEVKTLTENRIGGAFVLCHNPDAADLQAEFRVEGAEESGELFPEVGIYRLEDGVLAAASGEEQPGVQQLQLHSLGEGRFAFEFDGEEDWPECSYYILLRCRAEGKEMVSTDKALTVRNGVYRSAAYRLDRKAPILKLRYPEAARVLSGTKELQGRTPLPGSRAYYAQDICVTLTVEEAVLQEKPRVEVDGEEIRPNWEKDGKEAVLRIAGDGEHRFSVFYMDAAGNGLTAADKEQNAGIRDGTYESPVLVVDTKAPVLSCSAPEPGSELMYLREKTRLCLQVRDENMRVRELQETLLEFRAENGRGEDIRKSTELFREIAGWDPNERLQGEHSMFLPLSADGFYEIPTAFEDLAGNRAETKGPIRICLDTKAPELQLICTDPKREYCYEQEFFWFADRTLLVRAEGADEGSGMEKFQAEIVDEKGKKTELQGTGELVFLLPEEGSDFKGMLRVTAADRAGNTAELTRQIVTESGERHRASVRAEFQPVTKPGRVVNGTAYYNTDVTLAYDLQDLYSGIRQISYTGAETLEWGRDHTEEAEKMRSGYSGTLTLPADRNQGEAAAEMRFTDNTGREAALGLLCRIDTEKPVITVDWEPEQSAEGRFFHSPRTARIRIRENNFREEDVNFRIISQKGAEPVWSAWTEEKAGEAVFHSCTAAFRQDGDYVLEIAFRDLAGNEAETYRSEPFVIDCSAPEIRVNFDNNLAQNGFYYQEGRTAQITVREENFVPERFHIKITAGGDAEETPVPSVWTGKDGVYTAWAEFSRDGEYELEIDGEDAAGNAAEPWSSGLFSVDRTVPQLEILGVVDHSANSGEVKPLIRCHDTNLAKRETGISLQGSRSGNRELIGNRQEEKDGFSLQLENFPENPEEDDMYVLQAEARDLAGNRTELRIVFSVNRFGSVYTPDRETAALAGKNGCYYTAEEQDIVMTETNADYLETCEIIKTQNGKIRRLKEGLDYTAEAGGTGESWKRYTYRIGRENFAEEGIYVLTFCSRDRAGNASDNQSRGETLEFAVDKTAPSVIIAGAEDGRQYCSSTREITLDVQDNLALEEVEVYLDGRCLTFDGQETEENNGRIILTAQSAGHWQELQVQARDRAQNTVRIQKIRFLVTPNLLVQFLMNRLLLVCSGMIFAAAAVLLLLRRFRKH